MKQMKQLDIANKRIQQLNNEVKQWRAEVDRLMKDRGAMWSNVVIPVDIAELQEERDQLRADLEETQEVSGVQHKSIDKLARKRNKLRDKLNQLQCDFKKYGRHLFDCRNGPDCTCGFETVLENTDKDQDPSQTAVDILALVWEMIDNSNGSASQVITKTNLLAIDELIDGKKS